MNLYKKNNCYIQIEFHDNTTRMQMFGNMRLYIIPLPCTIYPEDYFCFA